MLFGIKLSTIKLGPNFSIDLANNDLSGGCLTNSSGTTNATWYAKGGKSYAKCGMGTEIRTEAVTYYDTPQTLALASNEKLLTSDTSTNQKVDNTSTSSNSQNTDSLTPDTKQDKSSNTEADTEKDKSSSTDATTKDKAADKTATQQVDVKSEEEESITSVLLSFTSNITSLFNSLKLSIM